MQPGDQATGVVVTWVETGSHAYGFIEVPGAARDVYVAADRLVGVDRLHVGQRVGFTVERRPSGRIAAVDVRLVVTGDVRAAWQLR